MLQFQLLAVEVESYWSHSLHKLCSHLTDLFTLLRLQLLLSISQLAITAIVASYFVFLHWLGRQRH